MTTQRELNSDQQADNTARARRTEAYATSVEAAFNDAVGKILALKTSLPVLPLGRMYSFDGDSKKMRRKVDSILRELHTVAYTAARNGVAAEWQRANDDIDAILTSAYGKSVLSETALAGWFARSEEALNAFITRPRNAQTLSERIWVTCQQLRDEMEVAMTVAIGEGQSASDMSRRVRRYLKDPDVMFRRFRYKDSDGVWQTKWKKRVVVDGHYRFIDYDRDSYKTGAGVYKSAYKNAMRVTRTETNIAYRRADHNRWQRLDFVLGQHITTSSTHDRRGTNARDECNTLQGDYPKDFVFDGWHPQCMCICTAILPSMEELQRARRAKLNGEAYVPAGVIDTLPQNFRDYIRHNKSAIAAAAARGTTPYFVRNNGHAINALLGDDVVPIPRDPSIEVKG